MQAHLSAAFILSVSVLCGVWAQVPFPGQCPEVKIMDTFDLEAYMGIWYEYSKYPFAFEIGKKCMYANYTLIDNSTVSVVNAAINRFTNNPSNVSGIAKVIAPAQLAVVFSKNQHATKPNYLVLSTDYDSYAVVYSCTNVTTLAHLKLVWILTRERLPAKQTISAALQVLDDNRINQALLIDTLQTNCPNLDNSSAYGNETTLDLEEEFVNNVLPNAIEKPFSSKISLSLLMLNYLTHYEVDCVWAFQGKCPQNVTAVGDFQMDRFLGKWYTYAMYPELKGRKHKCMSTEFIKNPDNSYEAKVVELNPSSDTVEVRTAKIARIRPTAGKFDVLVKNHTAFPEGIETYVLDTDYENYAIRYLCIESNEVFNFQWVAIQTRNRLPDSQHVSDAQKLAKASGITLSKLVRVPQDACPKDT